MKIAFLAAPTPAAQEMYQKLTSLHGNAPLAEAEVIVALGGDGFMLETMHKTINMQLPIFGIHCGSIGFLMNNFPSTPLPDHIKSARSFTLHPLRMSVTTKQSKQHHALAFNEISLLRESRQAAKIRIKIDQIVRLEELICDGILVATPAGSTAYNLSAHGPILPLGSHLLALTPISAFRPRRWRGALLAEQVRVTFEILEADKRPVSAVADSEEVRDILTVEVSQDKTKAVQLLFDKDSHLEEKILREQFLA